MNEKQNVWSIFRTDPPPRGLRRHFRWAWYLHALARDGEGVRVRVLHPLGLLLALGTAIAAICYLLAWDFPRQLVGYVSEALCWWTGPSDTETRQVRRARERGPIRRESA